MDFLIDWCTLSGKADGLKYASKYSGLVMRKISSICVWEKRLSSKTKVVFVVGSWASIALWYLCLKSS